MVVKPKAGSKKAPMELDDSQDDPARKGFGDLSAAFARSSQPMSESPVKEKMAKIRKMIDDKDTNQEASASTSSGGMDKSILDAIGALSAKMDGMALKSDLHEMKSDISKEIKVNSRSRGPIEVRTVWAKVRVARGERPCDQFGTDRNDKVRSTFGDFPEL